MRKSGFLTDGILGNLSKFGQIYGLSCLHRGKPLERSELGILNSEF